MLLHFPFLRKILTTEFLLQTAGQTMGAPLNPARAWVYDSVPVLVLNLGSSKSQKTSYFRVTTDAQSDEPGE
jgi:hypothetical protein